MEKLKLFISQPMRDKTNEEIIKEREEAIDKVKSMYPDNEIEVIDSFFKDAPHDAKPLWYLSKSLELLSTANIVYFCKGWDKYRGCKIEHECAFEYGIEVIEYEMELKDTIWYMKSPDYKYRFKGEYLQTKIRYNKLKNMVKKYELGILDFDPTCDIDIFKYQLSYMKGYLAILEKRAEIEKVDLS